jgi:glyoxylate reductase
MPRVLVTQQIDRAGLRILEDAGLEIDLRAGPAPMEPAALRKRVRGCDGLLSMLTDPVDAALMDTGPLRAISQHAVGVNNIDLAAARQRGIPVSHTPGVLTDATADLTLALILAVARQLLPGDRMMRGGGFAGWHPLVLRGLELRGATLGIVGWGRIGQAVAQRAAAFGMEVVHHSRSSGLPLEQVLERSDVLSLHCPLTPATHHLIDAAALRRMKRGALLINTARGPVVDEDALYEAILDGHIGGAGLDVHEHEPEPHPGLVARDEVVLLPHIGSATVKTRRRMATMAAQGLVDALAGKEPEHRVG